MEPIDIPPVSDVLYLSAKQTSVETMGGIFCSMCHQTLRDKKEFDAHYLNHNPDPKETVYTCVACYKQIKGYPSFRSHCYNIHTSKYKYKCQHCPKTFSKDKNRADHELSMHTEIFKCEYIGPPHCNKKFPTAEDLASHQRESHSAGPPYDCRACHRALATTADCERHAEQHASFNYDCPICSEHIGEKPLIREHLIKHFGDEPMDSDEENDTEEGKPEDSSVDLLGGIQCYVCLESLKNRSEFDVHFKSSHPEANFLYSCTVCDKQYLEYHRLGRHYYDHLMRNRFSCATCGLSFGRLTRLVLHATTCAGGVLLRCALCPARAACARRLAAHTKQVHRTNVLKCSQPGCEEQFVKPSSLVYHTASVHQRSDGWCRRCGLPLPSLSAAIRHMEVHRRALYSCPVCDRAYREKHLLLKHTPQHFESVLHVCKICGKVYNAKNRLVAHSKTHSDTQSLQCVHCDKRFATQYKYREHLNIHTGARPYQCTVCPKTFTNHPNWSKHLRKMHKIDPKNVKVKRAPLVQPMNNNTTDASFEMLDIEFPEAGSPESTELDSIEPTVLDVVAGLCPLDPMGFEDLAGLVSDSSSQDASQPLAVNPNLALALPDSPGSLDDSDSLEHTIALAIMSGRGDDGFM